MERSGWKALSHAAEELWIDPEVLQALSPGGTGMLSITHHTPEACAATNKSRCDVVSACFPAAGSPLVLPFR